jgi:hypothetical protein
VKKPAQRSLSDVWTPPNRSPRELRNARVKLVGGAVIVLGVVVAVLIALL